ncbi:hypothetical protein Bbelb_392940 [Branchiostoma belcheri]|nr:hypothetical protein Bbelb_392940 [Branchiostoma belcheri]
MVAYHGPGASGISAGEGTMEDDYVEEEEENLHWEEENYLLDLENEIVCAYHILNPLRCAGGPICRALWHQTTLKWAITRTRVKQDSYEGQIPSRFHLTITVAPLERSVAGRELTPGHLRVTGRGT